MAKNTIEVKLLGDNKDLKRALDGSGADVESFGSKAGKAFKMGAVALGALGAGAAIAVPALLNAGANIEAVGIKSATVFESSLKGVESWADGVAGSMGLTNTELIGAAASFGDLLKPMGFTADQAASMSTEMLDLSGALSAWSGGQVDATGAADVLAKAMLGERDGLKALGISITEADVSARLLENGTEGLTGAALQQAKALATQQLIMEKSTDAQTAWTNGSFDGIKAQNESGAAIKNVKDAFVTGLYPALQQIIPVVTAVAMWAGENLPKAFAAASAAIGWVQENFSQLAPIMGAIGAAAALAFGLWAAAAIPAAAATIAAAAPVIALGVAIAALAAGVVWAYQNVDWFRAAVDRAWKLIKDGFTIAVRVATVAIGHATSVIATASSWIQTMWNKTDALRSLAASGFRVAVEVATRVVSDLRAAITTAASWLQAAWVKTEALRSKIVSGLNVALTVSKIAFGALWQSIQVTAAWMKLAWDRSEGLRSLFSGSFRTAVNGIKTTFSLLRDVVSSVANAIERVIGAAGRARNAVSNIPGGGTIGRIAGALPFFHDGGFVGSATGPARDIPIMAQQGEYVLSRADVAAMSSGGAPKVEIGEVHMHNGTDVNALSASLLLAMAA